MFEKYLDIINSCIRRSRGRRCSPGQAIRKDDEAVDDAVRQPIRKAVCKAVSSTIRKAVCKAVCKAVRRNAGAAQSRRSLLPRARGTGFQLL